MKLEAQSLINEADAATAHGYEEGYLDVDDGVGVFAGVLRCVDCNEVVVVSGTSHTSREYVRGEDVVVNYFHPRAFVPALSLFETPDDLPEPIARCLQASFELFWMNPSAAGNALRVAVEELMTWEGIRKHPIGKRRRPLELHKRIELFKLREPHRAELLLAVKWIGNAGSHRTNELSKKDVLDGYRLFKRVLEETFHPTSDVRRLAKRINRARGPVRKSPKAQGA
jgi:hypothetical protein